jgi:hypothetical protein
MSKLAHPESASLSPLLSLVPSRGRVARLDGLTPSLYARYEGVAAMYKEIVASGGREEGKRFANEEAMLRTVLEWLAVRPAKAQ